MIGLSISLGSEVSFAKARTTTLLSVASSTSATAITVTGTTSRDITSGVYGVEFSINSVPGIYTFSLNTTGAASSQSIAIVFADYGINAGDTVYVRAYYNTDPLDDPTTRIYGTPTLTVVVTAQFMMPGAGYIDVAGSGQFMIPGYGYINL